VIDGPSDSAHSSLTASEHHGGGDAADPESRYPLRVLLIGSEQDVRETIKNLHHRGFAEATLWSRVITYPNREAVDHLLPVRSDSVVSILTKYLPH
jgi:alkanesulfonate monooxygenase SsuD/methylene tetrahydromethanopterin reductase-like flavin-dependent oxidoreductase (luciferase family)